MPSSVLLSVGAAAALSLLASSAHAAVTYRWITQDKLIEVENSLIKITIDTVANGVKSLVLKSSPQSDFFSYSYSDLNGDSPALSTQATFFVPGGMTAKIVSATPDLFDISLSRTVSGTGLTELPMTYDYHFAVRDGVSGFVSFGSVCFRH
jgi:hypothetical protein